MKTLTLQYFFSIVDLSLLRDVFILKVVHKNREGERKKARERFSVGDDSTDTTFIVRFLDSVCLQVRIRQVNKKQSTFMFSNSI